MPSEPDPNALVLRFRPMSAERLVARAAQDARRSDGKGHHTASVWVAAQRPGEDRSDVVLRLLALTELYGVNPQTNPDFWFCSTASQITELGFRFEKDEYTGEPEEHYSVVLGDPPTEEDAQRFVSAFTKERRRGRSDEGNFH